MKYFLATILVLLLVIVIGAGAFYFGKQSVNQSKEMATTPTPTAFVTQETPTVTPDALDPVKTVEGGGVLVFSAYTLNTPTDWNSQRQQGDNIDNVTLTKGGYKIVLSQAASGGGGCTYPGDTPAQFAQNFTTFVEIIDPNGYVFRRGPVQSNSWTVCQKNTSDGSFGFPTNFGLITITTPVNVDSKIMTEIDSILASLNKKI